MIRRAIAIISFVGAHLEVELDRHDILEPAHVVVLDVPPILECRCTVIPKGAAEPRLDRGEDGVGPCSKPRLSDGRDVIDVDAEMGHGRPSLERYPTSPWRKPIRVAAE
ncbi:MAG: hypothetical protein U0575_05525 [Phycisphaerales bacterium]